MGFDVVYKDCGINLFVLFHSMAHATIMAARRSKPRNARFCPTRVSRREQRKIAIFLVALASLGNNPSLVERHGGVRAPGVGPYGVARRASFSTIQNKTIGEKSCPSHRHEWRYYSLFLKIPFPTKPLNTLDYN
ncbi:hypothetical protein COV19_05070 [Candidatus Woesearchaeota archaeon CG10_big_fil_rev_8_21_14_0_10_44_13]|nr:MAG: hypothetical protein COV19_05070 [Candidatus Woesearchaeota archaeon CG10_big_fil_rev_8_21_14_0_10_44_13]